MSGPELPRLGWASFVYTPVDLARLARLFRQLTRELRIFGLGFGRIGVYLIWWRLWYPDVVDGEQITWEEDEIEQLQWQLREIDHVLDRRDALEPYKDRAAKIAYMCMVAGQAEAYRRWLESSEKEAARLRELVRRAWEFPDWPSPPEGEVSTGEEFEEQRRWRADREELEREIHAALDGPQAQQKAQ